MGAVTPLRKRRRQLLGRHQKGETAVGPITKFDTTDFKVKLAAEVKGFDVTKYMDFKSAKRMEEFSHFAIAAADEALRDSGINMENEDPYRVGVIVSSG